MSSDQVRARLMAMHLPLPGCPEGLSLAELERYFQQAFALMNLSLGCSYGEAARGSGLSELDFARLVRDAIALGATPGEDVYRVCLPRSTRRRPKVSPLPVPQPRKRRRPRPRGVRLLLRSSLSAAVRARISQPCPRDRVQAEVLAWVATELRGVIDAMVAAGELVAGPAPYFQETRHD